MKKRVISTLAVSGALLVMLAALFQVALAQTFTITKAISPPGGGTFTITPDKPGGYESGNIIALEAFPATGYTFTGWSDDDGPLDGDSAANPYTNYEVSASTTITATFTEIPTCHPLTAQTAVVPGDPPDAGNIVEAFGDDDGCPSGQFREGVTVTLQATPANGYRLASWTGATQKPDEPAAATVIMTGPKNVTATFALRCQTLSRTHLPPEGGNDPTASPLNSSGCDNGKYKKGTVITLTPQPDPGWRLGSWTNTDAGTNKLTMPGLAANEAEYLVTANYVLQPTLAFAEPSFQVEENGGPATITVKRTGPTTDAVRVNFATGAGGDTAVPGVDYVATNGQLNFTSGATTATFPVTILNNTLGDGDRELTLRLSNPVNLTTPGNGAFVGTPNPVKLKILDDEGDPAVQFGSGSYEVEEAAGEIAITVVLFPPPTQNVVVDFLTKDGTATAGLDYTAVSDDLIFRHNQNELSKTIVIPILDDDLDEDDETVQLILRNEDGAILGDNAPAELIILDDDESPTAQFANTEYFVKAGASNEAKLTVTLNVPSGREVEVDYSITANETRAAGQGTLTFAPGQTARDVVIPLAGTSAGDQFEAQLSTLINASLGQPSTAVLYILDTDISDCRTLQLTFTGYGEAPEPASKANSLGCPLGAYVAGESITLLAQPQRGWYVSGWQGIDDPESTALQNTLEMPNQDWTVNVDYRIPLFLPLTSGPKPFFEGPNEEEPNNVFAEANGPIRRDRVYFGGFPTAADVNDRYYFELGVASEVTITLDSIASGQNYDLYLYDTNFSNGQIGYSGRVGNLPEAITMTVEPGKYYIRVLRASGDPTSDKYEVKLVVK